MIEEGRGFTEAVVVDTKQAGGATLGTRFLFDGDGRAAGELAGGCRSRRARDRIDSARRAAQTVGS